MPLTLTKYDQYPLWNSIPVARNWHVTGVSQREDNIRKADRVAVTQQELGIAIDTDRIDPIIVPITSHGHVAG